MTESATLPGGSGGSPLPGWQMPDSPAPRHCGTAMEWRSPEPAAMSSYSFGPADHSLTLPALWRCRCGFQLDGIDQRAAGPVAAFWQSR